MTTDDATEVLTLRAAGERFGLSPASLREMAQRGELARARKRPGPGGDEWIVPVLTVEAIAAAGGSNGGQVRRGRATTSRRAPIALGLGGLLLGLVAAVVLVAMGWALAPGDGDGSAPAEAVPTGAQAPGLVAAALQGLLGPDEPVGTLGATAPALVRGRPAIALPATELPEVVVVAGGVTAVDAPLVEAIRDQGRLILTLSGSEDGGEVWQLPESFEVPTTTNTTTEATATPTTAPSSPPAEPPSAGPGSAAPDPPAATPEPPAGATVTVAPGQGFWQVAEQALEAELGRAPTVAETLPYWDALIDANLDQLPDPGNPDLLYSGTSLELPVR